MVFFIRNSSKQFEFVLIQRRSQSIPSSRTSTTANRINLTRASCWLLQTPVDFSRQDAEEGSNLAKSSFAAPLDVFAAAGLDQ